MQPLLSAFLKRYGWHFQLVDPDFFQPGQGKSWGREMIKRWIYESPIYMFISKDLPDFREWSAQDTEFADKEEGANVQGLDIQ